MNVYENPLIKRYASEEMSKVFSDENKFSTWRKLWVALAESQKELGLDIKDSQIEEMKKHIYKLNLERASEIEKETRHDVMAHVRAFGEQCPSAKAIIHLGATSAFVGDNTDIILMKQGLEIIKKRLVNCICLLKEFAKLYKNVPTLGFTHFQPAQLTTVGKRACLWIQDLMMDFENLESLLDNLKLRGVKGTTGTQASFLKLFNGNEQKVEQLDKLVCKKMGFKQSFPITGQTYPRKLDSQMLNILKGIAESAHKFSNDIRLLQHLKEIEEPFGKKQIGSSAMAYKKNPMRSERIAALARYVIVNSMNTSITASQQWLERTLDDSANRRIVIPEAFLAVDSILLLYINIVKGLVVNTKIIEKNVQKNIPFIATENIIMEAVKKGGDRQEIHERIRQHSIEALNQIKEGKENDLLKRIIQDNEIPLSEKEIKDIIDPNKFIGRSVSQVDNYIKEYVEPIISKYNYLLEESEEVKV